MVAIANLIPWRKAHADENALTQVGQEINRMVTDLLKGTLAWRQAVVPVYTSPSVRLDLTEDDRAVHVTAELPGMDEQDLDVSIAGRLVTIKGEKRHDADEWKRTCHRSERTFGPFTRMVRLPCEVSSEEATARLKRGVLEVSLPKTREPESVVRRVPVGAVGG